MGRDRVVCLFLTAEPKVDVLARRVRAENEKSSVGPRTDDPADSAVRLHVSSDEYVVEKRRDAGLSDARVRTLEPRPASRRIRRPGITQES